MPVDFETSPAISSVLLQDGSRRSHGSRYISLSSGRSVSAEALEEIGIELSRRGTARLLTAEELAILARHAGRDHSTGRGGSPSTLIKRLRAIVRKRPSADLQEIAATILSNPPFSGSEAIAACLPGVVQSAEMIDALIELVPNAGLQQLHHVFSPDKLQIRSMDQARRALHATSQQQDSSLTTYFISAFVRTFGLTAWAKLAFILWDMPELAGDGIVAPPRARSGNDPEIALQLRTEGWAAVLDDRSVRQLARLILDLDGALAFAGPDIRRIYTQRLKAAVGSDNDLRQATIEALLNRPEARQRNLGLYAATSLATPDDADFLRTLSVHPNRQAGYDADAILEVVCGQVEAGENWPRPTVSGIAEGLFQLRFAAEPSEVPQTWLGDRLLERMIEQTAAAEEQRFARIYPNHSEDGEEALLQLLFADLANHFAQLDQGLLATARATQAKRQTRIRMNYRIPSKIEEGGPGINRKGDGAPPSFSADLCLLVDPYLDGQPLGKRATLVQAKRLWRIKPSEPELGFKSSYHLVPKQMDDLLAQTQSSFYMFQGTGSCGRGIPILPTQLTSDLAFRQEATRKQIDHSAIGYPSQAFAHWLTYEVLALRTGDPFAELVAKAEGGIGRSPRELGTFGIAEIEIRVGDAVKEVD